MACLTLARRVVLVSVLWSGCGDGGGSDEKDEPTDSGVPVTVRAAEDAGGARGSRMDASTRPARTDAGSRAADASETESDVDAAVAPPAAPAVTESGTPAPTTPPAPPAPPVLDQDASVPPAPVPVSPSDAQVASPPVPVPPVPTPPVPEPQPDAEVPEPPVTPDPEPVPTLDAGSPPELLTCAAGLYAGPFTGQLASNPQATLSGRVTWRLVPADDGKTATLEDGALTANGPAGSKVTGQVRGSVDCASGQLRDGALRGSYAPPFGAELDFEGTLNGLHDASAGTLDGTWTATTTGSAADAGFEARGEYRTSL